MHLQLITDLYSTIAIIAMQFISIDHVFCFYLFQK